MTVTPVVLTTPDPQTMEIEFFREYMRDKIATHRWSLAGLARRSRVATTTLRRMLSRDPSTYRMTHPARDAVLRALEDSNNYLDCERCHGSGKIAKP